MLFFLKLIFALVAIVTGFEILGMIDGIEGLIVDDMVTIFAFVVSVLALLIVNQVEL